MASKSEVETTGKCKTLLDDQFKFRDASTVVCVYCNADFKYHRSTSSLSYHIRTKHAFKPTSAIKSQQLTMEEMKEKVKPMDQKKYDNITNAFA